ncbi:MAG: hypothetical protein ACERKV_12650 [Clostridiaceae bacterium]
MYDELGITNMIEKVDEQYATQAGYNLIDREITLDSSEDSAQPDDFINLRYIPYPEPGGSTVYLSDYAGYHMRYVVVKDGIQKNMGNILSSDLKNDVVSTIIGKTLNFIANYVPSPYSKLSSILSFSISTAFLTNYRTTILNNIMNHTFTYHYYEINDVRHKMSSADWYCLGYTMNDYVISQFTLSGHDAYYNPVTDNGEARKTYWSPHYFDDAYMQERIYLAYTGSAMEYCERTPQYITHTLN